MHVFLRRALQTALVTGGLIALGAGAAHAAEDDGPGLLGLDLELDIPLGEVSEALPDIDVDIPVTLDIAVVDVALGLLGEASTTPDSSPAEAAPAPAAPEPPGGTVDVDVPVTIDVDVTDIAVGLLGEASTSAPAQPPAEPSDLAEPAEPAEPAEAAEPAEPAGGGVDVDVPIELAVDISHLAVGVLGDASTSGESEPEAGTPQPQVAEAGTVGTVGAVGAVGGVTIGVPVRVPVSVTCSSLAVLGDAAAGCDAGGPTAVSRPAGGGGALAVSAPVTVPVDVGCLAIGVLGDAATACPAAAPVPGDPADPGDPGDHGDPGDREAPVTRATREAPVTRARLVARAGTAPPGAHRWRRHRPCSRSGRTPLMPPTTSSRAPERPVRRRWRWPRC